MRLRWWLVSAALWGCGGQASQASQAVSVAPTVVVDEALAAPLGPLGLRGVVAWKTHGEAVVHCSDREECERRTIPASTFKIANALIAVNAGAVSGADEVFPWDGERHSIADWDRDHTLKSAFAVSSVPVFQRIARKVGFGPYRELLPRFGYGNAQVGEQVDTFWLRGPLAINPIEQLVFLEKLEGKALPVSEQAREVVRDILVRETRGDAVLRGKTGWGLPGTPDEIGWFVGYSIKAGRTTHVAVRAQRLPGTDDKTFFGGRIEAAKRTLETLGAY